MIDCPSIKGCPRGIGREGRTENKRVRGRPGDLGYEVAVDLAETDGGMETMVVEST